MGAHPPCAREAQGVCVGLRCRFHEKAARVTRAAAPKPNELQAENEKKNPDWLAEVCVVFWTTLALTLEVLGPAALLLNEINAVPL